MNLRLLPALNIVLILSIACTPRSLKEPVGEESPVRFSNSYQPPHYMEEKRIQNIGEVLAESHQYYEAAAAANHLPGLAYG